MHGSPRCVYFCRHQADPLCSPWWQEHQRWWPQAWSRPRVPGIGGWGRWLSSPPSPHAHTHTHTFPTKKKKKIPNPLLIRLALTKPVSPLGMLQLEARQNKGQIVLMTIYPLLKDHFKGTLYFANIEPSSEQNYNCKSESFFLELFSLQGKGSSGTSMLASLFVTSLRSYTML